MIRKEVAILKKTRHTPDIYELILEKPKEFSHTPGQFINLKITKENQSRIRAYSLLSHPEEAHLRILVKKVENGFASPRICEMEKKDHLLLIGPFGKFSIDPESKEHFFYSAGTGLAPFIPMIRELSKDESNKIGLITGHKTIEDIPCTDELKSIQKANKNFNWKASLTKQETPHDWLNGRVHSHITDSSIQGTHYICGLKELIFDTEKILLQKGAQQNKIRYERFN